VTTVPLPPATLSASAVSSSQINLTWSDTAGESGYTIYTSLDGNNWSQLTSVGAGVTSYSQVGLAGSSKHYYKVTAGNVAGAAGFSPIASGTTAASISVPNAPSNVSYTFPGPKNATITWSDNSSNETGFTLQFSTDGRTWTTLATLPANTTSYSQSNVNKGTFNYYRVAAINTAGQSAWANS
jgi:fibronectin type 3 domain-containing protein